jgi:hypothetical protein
MFDDDVDGVRLSFNFGHRLAYCSSPQAIREYGELWWNDIDRGRFMIRPPELSGIYNCRVI